MATEVTRRSLFAGAARTTKPSAIRPPGAHPTGFVERCRDCNLCQSACPEAIIVSDTEGRPVVDFTRGACTFCEACVAACPTEALSPELVAQWPWRAAIGAGCLSMKGITCRTCEEACESRAIRFTLRTGGRAEPRIEVNTCTGCGACASVCPVEAIAFKAMEVSSEGAAA